MRHPGPPLFQVTRERAARMNPPPVRTAADSQRFLLGLATVACVALAVSVVAFGLALVALLV